MIRRLFERLFDTDRDLLVARENSKAICRLNNATSSVIWLP